MAKDPICGACGQVISATAALCPNCGAPSDTPSPPKKRIRPAVAISLGIAVVALSVVLCYVGATLIPLLLHGSSSAPPPPSHLTGSALSDATAPSSDDSGIAYAVSDVESGSDKDRLAMDGKTVTVSGYLVVATVDQQVIVDDATLKNGPRLKIVPAQPGIRMGDRARFTGVYDAADHTLKATSGCRVQ